MPILSSGEWIEFHLIKRKKNSNALFRFIQSILFIVLLLVCILLLSICTLRCAEWEEDDDDDGKWNNFQVAGIGCTLEIVSLSLFDKRNSQTVRQWNIISHAMHRILEGMQQLVHLFCCENSSSPEEMLKEEDGLKKFAFAQSSWMGA